MGVLVGTPRRLSGWTRWGFRTHLAFCLLLATAMVRGAGLTNPPPLRINQYAFASNGVLAQVTESTLGRITSVSYGESLTNALFSLSTNELARGGFGDSTNRAPSRPGRPQYRVDRWDRAQGLPGNKVNALLQTRDGYLWIGTVGGLARFDGVRFTTFTDDNTAEMRDDGAIGRTLFEDETGKLWIGTERGLLCRVGDRWVSFDGQQEVRGKEIRAITRRRAGGFWFSANDRVGYWDGTDIHWRLQLQASEESHTRILSLAETDDHTLWIGAFGCLWRAEPGGSAGAGTLQRFESPQAAVNGMMIDRHGALWIGTGRGVWKWRQGMPEPKPVSGARPERLVAPHGAAFCEGIDGIIWASTLYHNGVFRFGPEEDPAPPVRVADEVPSTLCVLVDREGAIWLGSQDQGLFRLRPQVFVTLAFNSNSPLDHIRTVAEAGDGSLWFASRAGIAHWTEGELTVLDLRALGPRRSAPITVLSSGKVWSAAPAGGWFEVPGFPSDLTNLRPFASAHSEIGELRTICNRADGTVWLGTSTGLYRVARESKPERIDGLSHSDIQVLLEDRQLRLWVGTAGGGLNCLQTAVIAKYTPADGLPDEFIGALHESRDGNLWIGTRSGICLLKEGRIAKFDAASALPAESVHCILEDDVGRLWLSHSAGITRVARRELELWLEDQSQRPAVAHFGTVEGRLNPESAGDASPSGWKGTDGRLWFPSRRGLTVVDPKECPPDMPPPRVWIEQVEVDGQSLPTTGKLQLPPGRARQLQFRFTTSSLHSPERVQLRYQLEPHDRDWREADSLRLATYPELSAGRYHFRVQARNHEGQWSTHDGELALEILPPIWQTAWARGGGILLLTGSAGGFLFWRLRRQRRRLEVERLESLDRERERIARDLHDHLGAQLAGIALTSNHQDPAATHAREALNDLNALVWSVKPGNDTLTDLADFLANFAQRFLSPAGITLDLDLPEKLPPLQLPPHVRQEIAALYKECLRNILQHAHASRVTVRLRTRMDAIEISVRDDGRGFDVEKNGGRNDGAEPRHSSSRNGLANFHTRTKSIGGSCRIVSAPGRGTEVTFHLSLLGRS